MPHLNGEIDCLRRLGIAKIRGTGHLDLPPTAGRSLSYTFCAAELENRALIEIAQASKPAPGRPPDRASSADTALVQLWLSALAPEEVLLEQ
jgi:hypothetical protein